MIEETYITILHPCNTQHDNGEKTSYANDNSISGCWRQNSKAMVEFLFFFGHVFGRLTDCGLRTIEEKKKKMLERYQRFRGNMRRPRDQVKPVGRRCRCRCRSR